MKIKYGWLERVAYGTFQRRRCFLRRTYTQSDLSISEEGKICERILFVSRNSCDDNKENIWRWMHTTAQYSSLHAKQNTLACLFTVRCWLLLNLYTVLILKVWSQFWYFVYLLSTKIHGVRLWWYNKRIGVWNLGSKTLVPAWVTSWHYPHVFRWLHLMN